MTRFGFDDVMAAVGITEAPAVWRAGWEAAQADFPADGVPFLQDDFLDALNQVCRFPEEILAPVRAVCAAVRADEGLSRLAWLWQTLAYRAAEEPEVREWPNPQALGVLAPMFPAAVQLAGLELLIAGHRQRGLPEEVTWATCRDMELWMRHALRNTGAWGFTRLFWMLHHSKGRLYRLGRLQFIHRGAYGAVRAYRQRATGRLLALSEPGVVYRRDGLIDGTNNGTDDAAWTATLEIGDDAVRGYPLNAAGYARQELLMLPLAEWEPVLAPGDPVLDLHIPADGRMDHAACGESLQQALAFFPRYFPELPPARAFVCFTWLFDTQYEQLLPPESNIVQFQREFYIHPVKSDDLDPFFRVFGGKPADLRTGPRDSTLRRAMLDYTLAGNAFRMAGGFLLTDGLKWGRQVYRTQQETVTP